MKTTAALVFILTGCAGPVSQNATYTSAQKIGGPCDGCEILYEGLPEIGSLAPVLELSPADEPGESLVINGTVVHNDGRTVAKDIILYIYHTDASGLYSPSKEQTAGSRHGHLRGWLKTGSDGRFTLKSIRPASYPERASHGPTIPAHIHIFVKEPDKNEYYIDEVRFLDDPLLTTEEKDKAEQRGGDLNIPLGMDSTGVWRGELRITLGKNVPGYW